MKKKTKMILVKANIKSNYKGTFLQELSDLNVVHIKSKMGVPLKVYLREEHPYSDKVKNLRENINALFKKLKISETLLQELKITEDERVKYNVKDLSDLINMASDETEFLYNRVIELERYINKAKIELENVNIIKKVYAFLEKVNLTRESTSLFKRLEFKVHTTLSKNLPNLKNLFEFSQFPNVYQIQSISEDNIVFYIIYPRELEKDLIERINIIHAEEVPILKKYLTSNGINYDRINKEIDLIEDTLSKYEKELTRLRDENLLKFASVYEVIQNIEEYQWAEQQFNETSSGRSELKFFVPINTEGEVIEKLKNGFGDNIIFESISVDKHKSVADFKDFKEERILKDSKLPLKIKNYEETEGTSVKNRKEDQEKDLRSETPTIMKNFVLFRPFETLTRLYGAPAYSETDPTPFLAITFPLLFGLMFGDIGHGLCLIFAGLIGAIMFRKKSTDFRNLCWIIFYCGWGAVLGGFLYGAFFGMSEIPILGIHLEPLKFAGYTLHNPLNNIMTVFIFAIIVGIFHINLGWSIQFINYSRQHRKYLAFSDSLCKILLLDGGAFLIFIYRFDINKWFIYPFPILLPLIPGLLLIFSKPLGRLFGISYLKKESFSELLGEGSIETFETLLSVVSNVASYIRLLALALAHIALMISIEAMINIIPTGGIVNQVLIVIGLIFGNLIVILLEGLLVFLNDLRLHFYEFFFKFYQGSGTLFFPFSLDHAYSNIQFKIEPEKDMISEEIEKEIETKKTREDIDKALSYITKKYL
jgi:vacuolar-type H+-ATPase subunit I/STV1